MTTAQYLAAIDLLRARPFPPRHGRSETGTSGPGYHVVALCTSEDFWDDDGTRRPEVEDQYEAECESLAIALDERWGASQMFSLWSVLSRQTEGEDIPEPWSELCGTTPYLHLWKVEERWVALGVGQWDQELQFQLIATVTEIDPP
ncbi:hypothetical protein OG204_04445 [Streptomyces sp. NBC_01387]|uniref:hypothetical protein n=1 Tax=unclassified Streptomyces TaxID=2593676 RepID=UPI002024CAC3|nr:MULTISPECIES: hypothetical protein [unclassified Streptomyces]MCX4552466.1 hypothetical protein [Streptomyces sp. NBC_01500]WSC23816.1 hypothetical protein OIE60_31405 [Streptomyces sp. NBC_01766]WSV57687.1 hypothetical protein OG282_30605 [Streptomyces sp. NBC_01014]